MQILLRNQNKGRVRLFRQVALIAALLPAVVLAQTPAEFQQILERLDRLEKQNRALIDQVTALRQELAASRGTPGVAAPDVTQLAEKADVQERQIQDQA